jgi:hypothetical protein
VNALETREIFLGRAGRFIASLAPRNTRAGISENICERICFAERRGIDRAGIGYSGDTWRAIIYSLDVRRIVFNERLLWRRDSF